jgi:hypothetical protein
MVYSIKTPVVIDGNCKITGEYYSVVVSKEELEKYESGALAQDAFSELSAADREFIISGVSPEGWKSVFGDGDVEEE